MFLKTSSGDHITVLWCIYVHEISIKYDFWILFYFTFYYLFYLNVSNGKIYVSLN